MWQGQVDQTLTNEVCPRSTRVRRLYFQCLSKPPVEEAAFNAGWKRDQERVLVIEVVPRWPWRNSRVCQRAKLPERNQRLERVGGTPGFLTQVSLQGTEKTDYIGS